MMRLRVRAYDVFGKERGIIPEIADLSYTDKLNDLPTLSLKVPAGGLSDKRLAMPVELALEASIDSGEWFEPANARFIATGTESNPAEPSETVTVPCLGIGMVLRWASIWDATPGDENGKRVFPASSAGKIMQTLLEAAAKRKDETGLLWANGAVSWSFTPEYDSAHEAWGMNAAPTFAPSDTVAKALDWLASKGAVDWRFSGRTLEVFHANGKMAANKAKTVLLRKESATALPVKADYQQIVTVAKFKGENGFVKVKSSPDAYRDYGRIEAWSEQGQVTTDATAQLYLDELLTRGKRPVEEFRREYSLLTSISVPHLWRDYGLGDWVSTPREELRVVEAGLSVDAKGQIKGWETLGTRIDSYLERLARKTTDLEGIVGTDSGKPLPDGVDTRRPKAPRGLVATADAIIDENGAYRGVISASWHTVTEATNNQGITVAQYRYYARREGAKDFTLYGSTAGNGASVAFYASIGRAYELRVSAVGENGRESALSDGVRVDVPRDAVPPPVPSLPVLSESLQIITAAWDGLDHGGQRMPPDFEAIEVHVTADAGATPEPTVSVASASRNLFLYAASKPGDYWVRLRARDRAGNVSAWTDPARITVSALVDAPGIKERLEEAARLVEEEKQAREAGQQELSQQLQAQADELAQSDQKINDAFAHFVEAYSEAAVNLIEISPYPPDAGTPGKSLWVAPDARVFRRRLCSEVETS